ncbi:MAG TPA: 50S ribosomal protein L9 [Porphyromonadaceae bacterium]|nr:50S ribosomal protein L9 [Porphyromonadaceae bacterium]
MEVILKEDVRNLGHKGDVVSVKNGYGRNFLIPQAKAIIATESEKRILAENIKQRAHKEEKIKNDALALAEKLEKLNVIIRTKCSESGKIYGSVNNVQLADAIAILGVGVDRKQIEIAEGAKEIGKYTATIKLHKEVIVQLPYEVLPE